MLISVIDDSELTRSNVECTLNIDVLFNVNTRILNGMSYCNNRIVKYQGLCSRIVLCLSTITKDIILVRAGYLSITYPYKIIDRTYMMNDLYCLCDCCSVRFNDSFLIST